MVFVTIQKRMKERPLEIKDRIYGQERIESAVILDLIESKSFQRLKGINQYGIPDEFYHKKNFSRYEHSVGVMLLLGHLRASEEERVAGLLHDTSHSAFSHVYDWVVGYAAKENLQDIEHKNFIRRSEIVGVLKKYGYSIERITDYRHFGLLEQESPNLCADRIDYALRELDQVTAKKIIKGLVVFNNQIVIIDVETARLFAKEYLDLQNNHWGGYEAVARYHLFSSVLKRALEKDIVDRNDFWVNDNHVVKKLKNSKDKEILTTLDFLRQSQLPITNKTTVVKKKFRYVDPPVLINNDLIRLTDLDSDFNKLLEKARKENKKGVKVPSFELATSPNQS